MAHWWESSGLSIAIPTLPLARFLRGDCALGSASQILAYQLHAKEPGRRRALIQPLRILVRPVEVVRGLVEFILAALRGAGRLC